MGARPVWEKVEKRGRGNCFGRLSDVIGKGGLYFCSLSEKDMRIIDSIKENKKDVKRVLGLETIILQSWSSSLLNPNQILMETHSEKLKKLKNLGIQYIYLNKYFLTRWGFGRVIRKYREKYGLVTNILTNNLLFFLTKNRVFTYLEFFKFLKSDENKKFGMFKMVYEIDPKIFIFNFYKFGEEKLRFRLTEKINMFVNIYDKNKIELGYPKLKCKTLLI